MNCQYFSFHTTAGIKKMLSQIRPFLFPIVLQWNFKIAKQHKKTFCGQLIHVKKVGIYLPATWLKTEPWQVINQETAESQKAVPFLPV